MLTAIFLPLAAAVAVLWVPDTVIPVGPGVDWRQGLALMRDNAPFRRLLLAYGLNGVANGLPATLILRPFNFETLATWVYRYASDERLAEASTAALIIVLVSLLPTCLLTVSRRDDLS